MKPAHQMLILTVLLGVAFQGCATEPVAGPGKVTVTQTTSTTTTSSIAPVTMATFIFAPASPAAGQLVSFNAFGSAAAPSRTITSYTWDFGDGTTKTGLTTSHDFAEGLFIITLTVRDSAGVTASMTQPLGVGVPLPPVTTTIIPTTTGGHYVSPTATGAIPADLTLFFQLLAQSAQAPIAMTSSFRIMPLADSSYRVSGTYTTADRTGSGTIDGTLVGTITPAPAGTFTGTITSTLPCPAVRNFSGPLTSAALQWTGGAMVSNSCGQGVNPLLFDLQLLKTDAPPAPPPTTTTSTTTTTVPANFSLSVAGTVSGMCGNVTIESVPDLGFPVLTANGPFQTTNVSVTAGTTVTLRASGGVFDTVWTNCDSVANQMCTVTMNANRCANCTLPSPSAAMQGDCTGGVGSADRRGRP